MQIEPYSLSEHLMFLTVRITALDSAGILGTGTAFYFTFGPESAKGNGWLVLVTNTHVLYNEEEDIHGHMQVTRVADRLEFNMHVDGKDGQRQPNFPVSIKLDGRQYDHPEVDLSVIFFGDVYADLSNKGATPYLKAFNEFDIESDVFLSKELSGINEATIVGYPIDLFDELNNYPLFRRGITALHPSVDFLNQPLGLLDIACWPGSSGSPVLVVHEPLRKQVGMSYHDSQRIFLGVVSHNYTYTVDGKIEKRKIATKRNVAFHVPAHLAVYVKAKALLHFRQLFGGATTNDTPAPPA